MDPIDEFLSTLDAKGSVDPFAGSNLVSTPMPAATEADLFAGSEPVPSATPATSATPASGPDVPANSAPAIVADVANTSIEAALAEIIRRVQAIEAILRRNGADL